MDTHTLKSTFNSFTNFKKIRDGHKRGGIQLKAVCVCSARLELQTAPATCDMCNVITAYFLSSATRALGAVCLKEQAVLALESCWCKELAPGALQNKEGQGGQPRVQPVLGKLCKENFCWNQFYL